MDAKIQKILTDVKTNVSVGYLDNKQKQSKKKKQRENELRLQNQRDKHNTIMNDFVFTAFMLGLKDMLDQCFLGRKIDFS